MTRGAREPSDTDGENLMTMNVLDFLVLAVVAAIAGAIGEALAGYSLGGCFVSAIVGYVGALIGFWIQRTLNLPVIFQIQVGGQIFPFVWAIIGSLILTVVLGAFKRRRNRRPLVY